MQDFIDNIIDFFWKKASDALMQFGEMPPTILGFYQSGGEVHSYQDLIPNIHSFDWSDPEERFEIYCQAFQKMKNENYNGLVSITESWITMINTEEVQSLNIDLLDINSSRDLLELRKRYPSAFERTESLTMYVEVDNQTALVWGRIFRENSESNSPIKHISEFVEFKEGEIDGLIKEARDFVYGGI
jgi:hypothetical protein